MKALRSSFVIIVISNQVKKSNLKTHQMAVYNDVKYPCDKCDFKASQKYYLQIHMRSIHEGFRYPCNECDYKGTTRGCLKTHQKIVHEIAQNHATYATSNVVKIQSSKYSKCQ